MLLNTQNQFKVLKIRYHQTLASLQKHLTNLNTKKGQTTTPLSPPSHKSPQMSNHHSKLSRSTNLFISFILLLVLKNNHDLVRFNSKLKVHRL